MIMYNAEGAEATVLPEQVDDMLATGWSKTPLDKKEAVSPEPSKAEAATDTGEAGDNDAGDKGADTDAPRKITIKKKSN